MDKFITRDADRGPTSSRKRPADGMSTPTASEKKQKQNPDDTLLNSNFYSPLINDNGDATPFIKERNTRKDPFLPAIILHQELINPKSTYEKIQSWAEKPVYFRQRGSTRHIHATDKNDFIKIKQQLSALQFKWTSHKAEDDIPKKLILKGIDKTYTEDEVCLDLQQQFSSVLKVKQLTKTDEDGKHCPLGVYLVYFKWSTRLSVAMKIIKYVCHHKITWNFFRSQQKARKVKQCYKCQWFDHHSSECGLDARCVKCNDKHGPGECSKVKGVNDPECCNCGGKHPASYLGCPKIKEHIRNNKKTVPDNKKPSKPSTNGVAFKTNTPQAKRKLSYNSVVKGGRKATQQRNQPVGGDGGMSGQGLHSRGPAKVSANDNSGSGGGSSRGGFSFIMGEIDSLFGTSYEQLMSTVCEFVPIYKRCVDDTQKRMLLLEFLIKVSP